MHANDAMRSAPTRKVVILTALSVESSAVLAHLSHPRDETHPSGTAYTRGEFQAESGTWDVLLVETGPGNSPAAMEVERAIRYFEPEVALLVGVAGGLKDVGLGDVVIASKIHGYESGKASLDFAPRADTGESDYALLQRARVVARSTNWLERIQLKQTPAPRAVVGPVAAGEKVIAETRSPEYQRLRQHYGDALAVEMEGRGFLTATHASPHVKALVIRGISDLIDHKADADARGAQNTAANHASAFAFEVLARFIVTRTKDASTSDAPKKWNLLWGVPLTRSPNFTGRVSLLETIRAHFTSEPSRLRPLTLFGLGGVGKSQLAVEYASRHAIDLQDYTHVFWLRSDEPSVLATSFATLTSELDLPEKRETEQSLKVKAVQRWLRENKGWLLIFDNAEQPALIRSYLPLVGWGHVLITSRNAAWSELARPLEVQVLERAESIDFLRKRTGQDGGRAADALAEALGDLPLALSQAAAYIEQRGKTLDGYLALFEQRRQELLARPAAPADYPHTVAATWEISLEQVRLQSPSAVELLSLCAFLAPSPLPTVWLTEGAGVLPAPLSQALADELQLDEALEALRRYSLIQVTRQELSLHRLVQAVMVARLGNDGTLWAEAALHLVHELFDFDIEDPRKRDRCTALFPHALAATRNAWRLRRELHLLLEMLLRMGLFWEELAEYERAHERFQEGLDITREIHGKDHVAEAEFLYGLGQAETGLAKLKQAQEHTEQALRLVSSATETHGHTPSESQLRNSLAGIFIKRGSLREAREHAERAFSLKAEAEAGASVVEPYSLVLGSVLLRQGQYKEALVHFERNLKQLKESGASASRIAIAASSVAVAMEYMGQYNEARDIIERSIADVELIYADKHPTVAALLRDLGSLHQRTGRPQKAQECCERALRIDESILGPDHLDVAADLNNLARACHELGDLKTARAHFERALAIEERVLGPHHIGLATVLDNYGRLLQQLDEPEQALVCFERSLAIYEQEHESDHPATANVLNNLGHLHMEMKNPSKALECLERAVAIDEKVYGPDHPELETDLFNLSSALSMQGKHKRAEEAYRRALTIREKQGATSQSFIDDMLGHARYHRAHDEWREGQLCLESALRIQEQLEPLAPKLADILFELGRCSTHLGDNAVAISYLERARSFPRKEWTPENLLQLHTYMSTALLKLGRTSEALACLEEAEALFSRATNESIKGLFCMTRGRVLFQARHLDKSRIDYERALGLGLGREEEDWFAKAVFELGIVMQETQDFQAARVRYEHALKLSEIKDDPDSPAVATISRHLGQVLLNLKEYDLAIEYFGRALRLEVKTNQEQARFFLTLADRLWKRGESDAALQFAEKAAQFCTASPEEEPLLVGSLLFQSKLLVEQQRWSQARAVLEHVLQRSETRPLELAIQADLHHSLGICFLKLGNLQQALTHHEKAVSLIARCVGTQDPQYALALFNLAMTLVALKKTRKAIRRLESARALLEEHDPHNPLLKRIHEKLKRLVPGDWY